MSTPSFAAYMGDGLVNRFVVPFPYLSRAHVSTTVNGTPVSFVWVGPGMVEVALPPVFGAEVIVRRDTPGDAPLVDFANGNVVLDSDLDIAVLQALYVAQEARDYATPGPPVSDGSKGDVVVGGSGTSWLLTAAALDKIRNTTREQITIASLAALDPFVKGGVVIVAEPRRHGLFVWTAANMTAQVAADPRGGVYVPRSTDPTGASGCWVRYRLERETHVEWFNVFAGAVDNTAAVQGAVNLVKYEAGGTLHVGGYYRVNGGIIHDGNDIIVKGKDRSSGFYTLSAGKQFWTVSGARHGLHSLILSYNAFTASTSDYCLWVKDAVQLSAQDVRIQGGNQSVVFSGGACADNTFINCDILYASGERLIYAVRGLVPGVNGAHHFIRCRFNHPYPVGEPLTASQNKGAWTASTAYVKDDLVTVGSYRLQCRVGGTSGAVAPVVDMWYGVDRVDGTATWQLCAHTNLTAADMDTGVSYLFFDKCDATGPFFSAFTTNHRFAGGIKPRTIYLIDCTVHGPLYNAAVLNHANHVIIRGLDCFNPLMRFTAVDATLGVYAGAGVDNLRVSDSNIHAFDDGIIFASRHTRVSQNVVGGGIISIRALAGTMDFGINDNTADGTPEYGYSQRAIVVDAGVSGRYNIHNNGVNNATVAGVTDGGTGAKSIGGNV